MADFQHRRVNVLVCSTIIENGIDIANANTMIIERADRFGLAQLHQLRGRVGRSNRQAYAYLMTPHPKAMTADAVKRLDALQAAGELGIGFTLATHDMEIRGAGELLGEEQSGQIETIGFNLYMEMLRRAVDAIKSGRMPLADEPLRVSREVHMHVQTLIPDDYLPDVHARLVLYKRIAGAADQDALDDLKVEIIDRFGPLPEPLRNLLRVAALKLRAAAIGIDRLDIGAAGGRLEFHAEAAVDPLAAVRLVQSDPARYRFRPAGQDAAGRHGKDRLLVSGGIGPELETPEARFRFTDALLDALAPEAGADGAAGANTGERQPALAAGGA